MRAPARSSWPSPRSRADRAGGSELIEALEQVDVLIATGDAQCPSRLDVSVLLVKARRLERERGNAHPIATAPPCDNGTAARAGACGSAALVGWLSGLVNSRLRWPATPRAWPDS